MTTYKLNNGLIVLARVLRGDIYPYTYANRKQAMIKTELLKSQGVKCHIGGIRPIFIVIDGEVENDN